ncbi:MAG: S8 family serine peptidase [Trebonia sp.]
MYQYTSGLIGSQHFALPAASLATVHAAYASAVATTGGLILSGVTPAEVAEVGSTSLAIGISVPARITEHLLTGPGIYWVNQYDQSLSALGGGQTDIDRSLPAGSDTTQDWNVYPLHTPLNSNLPLILPGAGVIFAPPNALSATRVGSTLSLNFNPFTDDTTGHTGAGYTEIGVNHFATVTGSYEVDDNGKVLQAEPITQARCFVLFVPDSAASAAGWGARDIEHAYKLPVGRDSHATVAVVEAFDTPQLESYLNVYRRQYGLKPCTVSNGCFRKVGQGGSARDLPASGVGSGWDLEATLDVDMVSAACPNCRILVVEANGQDVSQLAAAEDTAARLGAVAISNSYGTRETGLAQSYARAYDHPGHAIVASTGDDGYTAASFPANLASVTAAGGTELSAAKNKRGWSETAWNSPGFGAGGSGCSAYVAKPSWQHDKRCPGRTAADVSAVADNIAIYNWYYGGWISAAGTSASSPIIAGIYALAGNAARVRPGYEYAHAKALFDPTSGNNDWFFEENGAVCGYDYLCVAKKGYDAPTGLGTPDGIGAF